jgi:DeoR family fructose operon transcriptional repressor
MNELLNLRQQQIVDQLHHIGEVKVTELKEAFTVTEMTLRRDLEKLELLGLVKRTFGGAILASKDSTIGERTTVMAEAKSQIGRRAALLVQAGESIFLDGGSTTLQVARHLPANANLTVVTNALNVAAELADKKITTILLGGVLVEATLSLVGPIAIETISRMAFDKVFLGATGMDALHGFSNSNLYEAEIKRIAIQKAKEAIIVLDHSKFGEQVFISFSELAQIQCIVSDQLPEGELLQACNLAGITMIRV